MAPFTTASNPFLSTLKAADAVPAVLHPLVLLSISDHITRHTLRKQPGPVVGALLGQQNGRQVTLEHTFEFVVDKNDEGDAQFNAVWFNDRIEQMKLVHKDRNLDLVGWYTVLGRSGPTAQIMQVHERILPLCSESTAAVLLAFHAEDLSEPSVGGKLPLTLYETHYEQDEKTVSDNDKEDKEMTDAPASSAASAAAKASSSSHIAVKLREITYTVETDESEMISIDFVARGAANASVERSTAGKEGASSASNTAGSSSNTNKNNNNNNNNNRDRAIAVESGNRKRRLVAATEAPTLTPSSSMTEGQPTAGTESGTSASDTTAVEGSLSTEEEELIATLTTRANAIRMLHARLQLLTKYLASLPEDALENSGSATEAAAAGSSTRDSAAVGVSLPILRSIQALVQRLPLVVPPPVAGVFEEEQQRQANDVNLISLLLDDMMQNISSARQVGDKFGVLDSARSSGRRQVRGGGAGGEFYGRNTAGGSSAFDTLM
ncbi:hypothetical protein SBRCBS47491_004917 [Sporothrix bragantina]|uniref:COP9 signalosome complex subunit 6 n=1 Tax=Sporothrix bragantina TaxID=671064 RepID=A0ABP0BSG9_9PEZI